MLFIISSRILEICGRCKYIFLSLSSDLSEKNILINTNPVDQKGLKIDNFCEDVENLPLIVEKSTNSVIGNWLVNFRKSTKMNSYC